MNTDTELDTALGRQAGVPLDHAVLHLNSASQSIDDAAKLDKTSVTCAFHHPPVMQFDSGIDQVAAERPQARQGALLVRAGEAAVADHIRDQYRRDLAGFAHSALRGYRD
jgi:hypothetical protein